MYVSTSAASSNKTLTLWLSLILYVVVQLFRVCWYAGDVCNSVPSRILTSLLVRICFNDKFIEIFAQRFHYFEDPFYKFFVLNLLFQATSYSLALKYSSFLFKFFNFALYNNNFWFKISKICPKILHFSQNSHSRENTGVQVEVFKGTLQW